MTYTIKCKNGNLIVTFLTNNAACTNDIKAFMRRYKTVCAFSTRHDVSVRIEEAFRRETEVRELVIYFK